jgi:hypothetical protein
MRRCRSNFGLACIALAALVLAACEADTGGEDASNGQSTAAGANSSGGIVIPERIADFQRTDLLRRDNGRDVTAGYVLADNTQAVTATIRIHPVSSGAFPRPIIQSSQPADADASTHALEQSIAQVRHYYPHAALSDVRNAFLVQGGALQTGRAATLRYDDLLGGTRQPIDLDIYIFCCLDDRWAYEYRIRHAADHNITGQAVRFMQDFPWPSPTQLASGETP